MRQSGQSNERPRRSGKKSASSEWVKNHLARQYNVPPQAVLESHSLEHWGHGDPSKLADVAGAFNHSTRSREDLGHAFVTPPELITGLQGKTIGDLISALDAKIETVTVVIGDVTKWLLDYLNSNLPGQSIKITTKFASIPFPPGGNEQYTADLVAIFNEHARDAWQVEAYATAIEAKNAIDGQKVSSLRDYLWSRVQDGLSRRPLQ